MSKCKYYLYNMLLTPTIQLFPLTKVVWLKQTSFDVFANYTNLTGNKLVGNEESSINNKYYSAQSIILRNQLICTPDLLLINHTSRTFH